MTVWLNRAAPLIRQTDSSEHVRSGIEKTAAAERGRLSTTTACAPSG